MSPLVLGVIAALALALIVTAGIVVFIVRRREPEKPKEENGAFLLLQNQLNELTRTLDAKLGELPKVMQGQFGESAKIVREVTERLTKLDETNRQV
ncbi:MAG: DNA recombination protein RmuC, partial [Candidatus Colwellbacteria bacterium]|nr:DNA recombination protein RmuC [Candidatus Colwellbacteria bacterium]